VPKTGPMLNAKHMPMSKFCILPIVIQNVY
jgi:hypothetical protein